ncbi:MAG: hypothetical protein DRP91_09215, partial [Candidatus Neomarinimicrobiota bacterium]
SLYIKYPFTNNTIFSWGGQRDSKLLPLVKQKEKLNFHIYATSDIKHAIQQNVKIKENYLYA